MKKVFTLIVCTCMVASVFASDITIAFAGNKAYRVLIDGRTVSNYNYYGNTISLNNFQPGRHAIEVYRMKNNKDWDDNKLVYSTNFLVRPQYDLFINIGNNGRVAMEERRSAYGNDDRRNDRDYDRNNRDKDRYDRRNGDYNNRRYDNNNDWNNNRRDNDRYNQAMSNYNFNQLVQRIRSQWFGKFNTAREAVNNNNFNTYQVKQLMLLFSSDSERLELAKQAYRNTVDPRNYSQVYDALSYASQNELSRYIRNDSNY